MANPAKLGVKVMKINLIREINKKIRNTRPHFSENDICDVFRNGDLLEIGFLSKQCINDMTGSCIMCDYGCAEKTETNEKYLEKMRLILNENNQGVNYLLLCSNGSILNDYQISEKLLIEILQCAQQCRVPKIIIETHYQDVTESKLQIISKIIKKPVIIEMGLETLNSRYHETMFMKGIDLNKYEETINRIKRFGYEVELNLMFGIPFLSEFEQYEDTLKAIHWVINHNCKPIIFPINIKPHTLLRYAYDKGLYKPVSLWLLVHVLDCLECEELCNTLIAWYGNRDEPYPNDIPTVFPDACDSCRHNLEVFFRSFMNAQKFTERKTLISELIRTTTCDCCWIAKKAIEVPRFAFEKQFETFYRQLKDDFGGNANNKE